MGVFQINMGQGVDPIAVERLIIPRLPLPQP